MTCSLEQVFLFVLLKLWESETNQKRVLLEKQMKNFEIVQKYIEKFWMQFDNARRRFSFVWRWIDIKQDLLINEQIRFKEVQVIDDEGNKLDKMSIDDAMNLAMDKNLDLVLVSSNPSNPVCKLMNYGKYKFEQAKREKESKKKQKTFELKELRVTPNIEEHDFNFKVKNAKKFLADGNKVKITVRFRGRELNYVKLGEQVLNKFVEELSEDATLEKKPLLEGKNMFIILAPNNK